MTNINSIPWFLEQEQNDAWILREVSTVWKLSQEMRVRLLELLEDQRVESDTVMSSLHMYFISQSNILLWDLVENTARISSLQYDEIMMLSFAYHKWGKQSEIDKILSSNLYEEDLKNFLSKVVIAVPSDEIEVFLETQYHKLLQND